MSILYVKLLNLNYFKTSKKARPWKSLFIRCSA